MKKKLFLLALFIGLMQFAAYRVGDSMASLDGVFPAAQPDTTLYCQAARRIVEGRPFSYSAGEAASTGTTSVLYPFVLAIPYAMGAKGANLLDAGFILNGIFYLIFLLGWTVAIHRLVSGAKAKILSVVLLALAGQPAFCVLAQSDIGLWMAVSAVLAAALALDRFWLALFLAVLGPWVRPEGMVVGAAFAAGALISGKCRRKYSVIAVATIVSTVLVFAFNYYLTGRFQFDSVAHKGLFKTETFPNAVTDVTLESIKMFKSFFAAHGEQWTNLYLVPILGGVMFWLGIVARKWKPALDNGLAVVLIACAGSFAVVASSGWAGTNMDRYLAWTMPVFCIFTAQGAVWLSERPFMDNVRLLPPVVMILGSLWLAVALVCLQHGSCRTMASDAEFNMAAEKAVAEEDARVGRVAPGTVGGLACNAAYWYSDRRFFHLSGLYSPAFFETPFVRQAAELLQHNPELRFDYWHMNDTLNAFCPENLRDEVYGEPLILGPGGFSVRKADWSAFDCGAAASRKEMIPGATNYLYSIDVGYDIDEKATDYKVIDRWGREEMPPFWAIAKLDGKTAVDAGRVVTGGDMMTVPLEPGLDCEVSMRTLAKKGGNEFRSPIKMLLSVDGEDVKTIEYSIDLKTNDFQVVSFVIPGLAIKQKPCRIGFLGEHIVCGYWFRQ